MAFPIYGKINMFQTTNQRKYTVDLQSKENDFPWPCCSRPQEDNPESANCRTEESFSGAKDINDTSFWKNFKSKNLRTSKKIK